MIERDYIMRMIQQFARFVARIISKKQSGNYEEALREIDATYKQLLGLDPYLVESLSENDVLALIGHDPAAYAEKCLVLGQLLKEKAEILELKGEAVATTAALYLRSFGLYMEALARNERLRDETHFEQVDFVRRRLRPYELPGPVKVKLLGYLEMTGRYSEAEDVLFELVEANHPDILHEGIRFYERLRDKSDDELAAGGLPRDEVEEGRRALMDRAKP